MSPAPKGSKNALGHDGHNAGRKSFYQEKANAEFLAECFFKEQDRAEITKKIRSGKYSVSSAMMAKAMAGDVKIMIEIFKKLFPDTFKGDMSINRDLFSSEELRGLIKDIVNARNKRKTGSGTEAKP